jgi:hypothetical protein
MGAGNIQLVSWGAQNKYIMGNPSLTFFKSVYKTHTNFAMESISIDLNRTDANVFEPTVFKAKIPRNGDLVVQVYFVFQLPPVISDSFTRFRWLENIGEAIIANTWVTIGNVIVDRQSGEYMNIYNNLTLPSFRREMYNKMIGNVSALTNPFKEQILDKVYSDSALKITKIYPSGNTAQNPTLPAQKCFVPLRFWFNRDFASALPIVALQYMDVEISIELRPIYQLYQLYYYPPRKNVGEYQAPDVNNPQHHIKNYISNDLSLYLRQENLLDLKARLEVNFVYLDKDERNFFVSKPLEFLIDQCTRIDQYKLGEHNVLEFKLHNMIKEFYWVFRRSDAFMRNAWFDFLDGTKNIMRTVKFMFNGVDRIEEKEPQYFNYLIPFQHHVGDPSEGIYCYPFAINPDEGVKQPSGSVNCSRIDKFQFVANLITPDSPGYFYDLIFFASGYNFLRINGGVASLFYTL